MKKNILSAIKTFLVLAIAFALATATAFAWQAPTSVPTGGNVPAPINTGNDPQSKLGGIFSNSYLASYHGFFGNDQGVSNCGLAIILCGMYNSKGLRIDNDGNIFVTTATAPAVGDVLKASNTQGQLIWGPASGGGNSTTTSTSSLPLGTVNQTLRNVGPGTTRDWQPTDVLKTYVSPVPNITVTGNANVTETVNAKNGMFGVLANSRKGVFGCTAGAFCTDNTSTNIFTAGIHDGTGLKNGLYVAGTTGTPVVKDVPLFINLQNNSQAAGRDALRIMTSNGNMSGGDGAVLSTNADRFSFYNWPFPGGLVGITAKNIRLTEGAGTGKILTSSDPQGNAVWADAAPKVTTVNSDIGSTVVIQQCDGSTANGNLNGSSCDREGIKRVAVARCPSGTILTGGGGRCDFPMQGYDSYPGIGTAQANQGSSPDSWIIKCGVAPGLQQAAGNTQSFAICMKAPSQMLAIVPPAQAPGGGNSGTNPPATPTWHDVTKATGTNGQSCASWLAGYPNFSGNVADLQGVGNFFSTGSSYSAQQTCAYTRVVAGTTYCDLVPSFVLAGTTYQMAPTKSCVGIVTVQVGLIAGEGVTIKTQIKY